MPTLCYPVQQSSNLFLFSMMAILRKEQAEPTFHRFFENLGEKPFYIAELSTSSTLQTHSPRDFAKNTNVNWECEFNTVSFYFYRDRRKWKMVLRLAKSLYM